jgi:hypothetical protein
MSLNVRINIDMQSTKACPFRQTNFQAQHKPQKASLTSVLRGTAVLLCCSAVSRHNSDRNLVCRTKHHRTAAPHELTSTANAQTPDAVKSLFGANTDTCKRVVHGHHAAVNADMLTCREPSSTHASCLKHTCIHSRMHKGDTYNTLYYTSLQLMLH